MAPHLTALCAGCGMIVWWSPRRKRWRDVPRVGGGIHVCRTAIAVAAGPPTPVQEAQPVVTVAAPAPASRPGRVPLDRPVNCPGCGRRDLRTSPCVFCGRELRV